MAKRTKKFPELSRAQDKIATEVVLCTHKSEPACKSFVSWEGFPKRRIWACGSQPGHKYVDSREVPDQNNKGLVTTWSHFSRVFIVVTRFSGFFLEKIFIKTFSLKNKKIRSQLKIPWKTVTKLWPVLYCFGQGLLFYPHICDQIVTRMLQSLFWENVPLLLFPPTPLTVS